MTHGTDCHAHVYGPYGRFPLLVGAWWTWPASSISTFACERRRGYSPNAAHTSSGDDPAFAGSARDDPFEAGPPSSAATTAGSIRRTA